jgi:hypothetical protein
LRSLGEHDLANMPPRLSTEQPKIKAATDFFLTGKKGGGVDNE